MFERPSSEVDETRIVFDQEHREVASQGRKIERGEEIGADWFRQGFQRERRGLHTTAAGEDESEVATAPNLAGYLDIAAVHPRKLAGNREP